MHRQPVNSRWVETNDDGRWLLTSPLSEIHGSLTTTPRPLHVHSTSVPRRPAVALPGPARCPVLSSLPMPPGHCLLLALHAVSSSAAVP